MPDTTYDRPAQDDFELSLFGPGIGECVVIHVGNGEWIVIDSCKEGSGTPPIALDYLNRLGVDVASAIKIVAITHWHDDHIKGAAELVRAASQATVVCPAALRAPELAKVTRYAKFSGLESSGIHELAEILDILLERKPKGADPSTIGPEWT